MDSVKAFKIQATVVNHFKILRKQKAEKSNT